MEQNMGLKKKINLLVLVVGVLVFLCSVTLAVMEIKRGLTDSAEHKISEVTELAYNVIDGYKKRADRGELTVPQAQDLALKAISNFRYQGFNYVWVNDYNDKFLVHPTNKRGVDSSKIADANGKKFLAELTQLAKSGQSGFISYVWTKPGDPTQKLYPKISTAVPFKDWNWVIATGVYVDEIDNTMNHVFWQIFIANIVALIILVVAVSATFVQSLVKSMNNITDDLQGSSGQVEEASYHLQDASHKLAEGATEQAASIQETSSTLEETSSMIYRNNENIAEAAHLAQKTKDFADQSNAEMKRMMNSVGEIKSSSQEISKIIKAIDDIAFQTNLLALNAAVEAARAGDVGKGFAVVAEEVRNLAQKSAQAAKETSEIISLNIGLSNQGVDIAGNVYESIASINEQASKVSELLAEISVASKEQAIGVEQINKAIAQMEIVLQNNAQTADQSASASQELSAQSSSMKDIVHRLTLLVNGHD